MRVRKRWALIVLGLAVVAMVLARTFSGPARGHEAQPAGPAGAVVGHAGERSAACACSAPARLQRCA